MPSRTKVIEEELERHRAEKEALEKEIRESEEYANNLILAEKESHKNLPPFEEILQRKKEDEFDARISQHEAGNYRREINHSMVLNLLLFLAMCASLWWIYQTFHHLIFPQ